MTTAEAVQIDVALVHAPVVNRNGEVIGSAVTNLDLHDIARAGKTYGVDTYWVVTPYSEQQTLVRQIIEHWTQGHGAKSATDRAAALSIVQVVHDVETVIARSTQRFGRRPLVLATCAAEKDNQLPYGTVRERMLEGEPVLLLFGTAWGLAPQVMEVADAVLPPIRGVGAFNHLSVRSAVSIILDRLTGEGIKQQTALLTN